MSLRTGITGDVRVAIYAARHRFAQMQVAGPATFDAQLAAFVAHGAGRAPWPLPADDPLRSMQAIDLVRGAA